MAEHWDTKAQRTALLEEALAVAQEQRVINRIVTVSAWPLAVLVKTAPEAIPQHLRRLINLAGCEEHTLRRADALHAVARAVRSSPALLKEITPSLVDALLTGDGWRIDRLIRSTVEMIAGSMPEAADKLIEHHSDGRKKETFVASMSKPS